MPAAADATAEAGAAIAAETVAAGVAAVAAEAAGKNPTLSAWKKTKRVFATLTAPELAPRRRGLRRDSSVTAVSPRTNRALSLMLVERRCKLILLVCARSSDG